MTYRDYYNDHPNENLGWCRPFTDDNGAWIAEQSSDDGTIMFPNGAEYALTDKAKLRDFAKLVNPNYDMYQGYTDYQIALDAMRETGCAHCPWNAACDVMDYELGEDND